MDEEKGLSGAVISKVQMIGRVEEKLLRLLEDDIFEMTSKHHPYWEDGDLLDKMQEVRCKVLWIEEVMWEVVRLLKEE